MATIPRIPKEFVDGYFVQMDHTRTDHPLAQIAVPIELSTLAGIPIQSRKSLKLDPVVHELIRLYNGQTIGCTFCQNVRQAIAVQSGLEEDMVQVLRTFETSDLPPHIKAAVRIAAAMANHPKMLSDEIRSKAREYFSEQEIIDIILLAMHTSCSKTLVTLGLDPGKNASSRLFFPAETGVFGDNADLKEAITDLRRRGFHVDPPTQGPVAIGTPLRPAGRT